MRQFDSFVAIDWSGAKTPRQKGIAIAVCGQGKAAPTLINPGIRWSRESVLDWLNSEAPVDALIGFDLSPSLPFGSEGFFPGWDRSPGTAKALWQLVDELCADDPHLSVSSFVAHPEARRHFRHAKGDCGDLFEPKMGRLRETERRQAAMALSPSSCFNLIGAAQVGKSSLTGMRLLNRLPPEFPVWPFDEIPDNGSLVVEIYTSLAARAAGIRKGLAKMRDGASLDAALGTFDCEPHAPFAESKYDDHSTDAILTAAWLRTVAHDPALWNPPGLDEVRHTEGWTFGVV